jgi:cyclic pyranopterin phosphate synthase
MADREQQTSGLTHLDESGAARMVDVGGKNATLREAVARGELHAPSAVIEAIATGTLAKGEAMAVARVAGIQAAKRTSEIIPLCHPIATQYIAITIRPEPLAGQIVVETTVRVVERTGAEMEALVGTTTALLTLYDMAKSMEKGMRIEGVRLVRKTGGKSGDWQEPGGP